VQRYVLFYFGLYDSEEWWCGSILFWKSVYSCSVHCYGRDSSAKLVVRFKHEGNFSILLEFAMQTEADNADQQHMFWVVDAAAIAVATGNDFTNETVRHVKVTSKVCFFFRNVYSAG
jgi:hypothetical protein